MAKKKEADLKRIEEVLIKIGVEVAKKGEGALFVISEKVKYKKLLKQKIESFSIFEEGANKILLSIAMIDGAVIINTKGEVVQYGAKIDSRSVFRGYGTRHSAAYTASKIPGSLAILISQEEKKIKIFRDGKIVVQIDALQKGVEKQISRANEILESIGIGTLTTIGAGVLAPSLGIAIVPGIILFGAPYYILKKYLLEEK